MPRFRSATWASVIFQKSNGDKDFNFPLAFKRSSSVSLQLKGSSTATCCHRSPSPMIASPSGTPRAPATGGITSPTKGPHEGPHLLGGLVGPAASPERLLYPMGEWEKGRERRGFPQSEENVPIWMVGRVDRMV